MSISIANVLQPDLLVLESALPESAPEVGVPLIVFEILSPSTAFCDRRLKRRLYLEAGVKEVWIVDAAARTIVIHTRDDRRAYGATERAHSSVIEDLEIEVGRLLR